MSAHSKIVTGSGSVATHRFHNARTAEHCRVSGLSHCQWYVQLEPVQVHVVAPVKGPVQAVPNVLEEKTVAGDETADMPSV